MPQVQDSMERLQDHCAKKDIESIFLEGAVCGIIDLLKKNNSPQQIADYLDSYARGLMHKGNFDDALRVYGAIDAQLSDEFKSFEWEVPELPGSKKCLLEKAKPVLEDKNQSLESLENRCKAADIYVIFNEAIPLNVATRLMRNKLNNLPFINDVDKAMGYMIATKLDTETVVGRIDRLLVNTLKTKNIAYGLRSVLGMYNDINKLMREKLGTERLLETSREYLKQRAINILKVDITIGYFDAAGVNEDNVQIVMDMRKEYDINVTPAELKERHNNFVNEGDMCLSQGDYNRASEGYKIAFKFVPASEGEARKEIIDWIDGTWHNPRNMRRIKTLAKKIGIKIHKPK